MLVCTSLLYAFRSYFIEMYTSSVEVQKLTEKMFLVFCFVVIGDFLQGVVYGVVKALGQ